MHAFRFLIAGVVLALTVNASTAGTLGFVLGDKAPDGTCKTQDDYNQDLEAIGLLTGSSLVRTYAAAECSCAQYVLQAAAAKGFQVVLGIWADTDDSFYDDIDTLQGLVLEFPEQVYGVTVGSECMYRGALSAEELLERIKFTESALPTIQRIGSADTWNSWVNGTADNIIKGGVNFFLASAYAYWQGSPPGYDAVSAYFGDLQTTQAYIEDRAPEPDTVEVWTGETGWPSDGGSDNGEATASTMAAAEYYNQAICEKVGSGGNVFVFEAFDELWKPPANGKSEVHWGVMYANRTQKYAMLC